MDIQIKYHDDMKAIEKCQIGDWIDLRSAKDIYIRQGDYTLIPLGVSMKLPDGYEAHILPRSSTFKNYGIIMVNHMGIIDNSYSGTNDIWQFPAYCLKGMESATEYGSFIRYSHIPKDDRICQFRIVPKQPELNLIEVDTLDDVDRGGFGTTGTK